MDFCLKTIHSFILVLSIFIIGCGNEEWTAQSVTGTDFCVAFPTAAECNGGDSGTAGAQFSVLTPSSDGVIRMEHTNPSNPDFGSGYARLNVRNSSTQTVSGNFSLDQNGNNLPITALEICPRANDAAVSCSGAVGNSVPFSVAAGATGYFLVRVEADGTIPFVPVVNAIYLRVANPDPLATVKIPIANEK